MSFIETSGGDYLNLAEVRQLHRVRSPQRGNTERLIANTKDNGQVDCGPASYRCCRRISVTRTSLGQRCI